LAVTHALSVIMFGLVFSKWSTVPDKVLCFRHFYLQYTWMTRLYLSRKGIYIILYVDDILIVARSVCELENVLYIYEEELNYLDMAIDVFFSSYVYKLFKQL